MPGRFPCTCNESIPECITRRKIIFALPIGNNLFLMYEKNTVTVAVASDISCSQSLPVHTPDGEQQVTVLNISSVGK